MRNITGLAFAAVALFVARPAAADAPPHGTEIDARAGIGTPWCTAPECRFPKADFALGLGVLFPLSRRVLLGPVTELTRIHYTDTYGVENDPYSLSALALFRLYFAEGRLLAPWVELGPGIVVTNSVGLEAHAGAGLRVAPDRWFFIGPSFMLHAQALAQGCEADGSSATSSERCRPANHGYFSAELVLGVEFPRSR